MTKKTEKMEWFNLKKNKCPKCGKDFMLGLATVDGLLAHDCGFRIRESRYKEIVNDMVKRDIDSFLDNEEREREEFND